MSISEAAGPSAFQVRPGYAAEEVGESKLGRLVDALAHGGDEGRDKLR